MSDATLDALAGQPVGMDQINRARDLCGQSTALNGELDAFLGSRPNRGQMLDFIETLKLGGLQRAMEANIARICESVGINEPTGTDKLLALQIGLLQEQNQAIARLAYRTNQVAENTKEQPSIFGPLLMGILLGKAF